MFLFIVILLFGILGIVNINLLNREFNQVLKSNHESIVYSNDMLKALDKIKIQKDAISLFEESLVKQESNITEVGEKEATQELRKNFNELKANPDDSTNYPEIRASLSQILDLNEMAVIRKYNHAQKTADNAKIWLTAIFSILTLISFTFIFNLPGIISNPDSKIIGRDFSHRR